MWLIIKSHVIPGCNWRKKKNIYKNIHKYYSFPGLYYYFNYTELHKYKGE